MISIGIETDIRGAQNRLEHVSSGLVDFRPCWKEVESIIIRTIRLNFMAGGRPAWEPVKNQRPGKRPLIGSGTLFEKAVHPRIESDRGRLVLLADVGVAGMVHQFGFEGTITVPEHARDGKGRRKSSMVHSHSKEVSIPERPFFMIPYGDSCVSEIERCIVRHIVEG
mgnify:FL=1